MQVIWVGCEWKNFCKRDWTGGIGLSPKENFFAAVIPRFAIAHRWAHLKAAHSKSVSSCRMIRDPAWVLESRPKRCLQPAKMDRRHFQDYPLTGPAADLPKSALTTLLGHFGRFEARLPLAEPRLSCFDVSGVKSRWRPASRRIIWKFIVTDNVADDPQQVIVDLKRRLDELIAQQTAAADVLKVISRSTFDLQTVLETLIRSAVELSGANRGSIFLREGDVFPLKAASSTAPEFLRYWSANSAEGGPRFGHFARYRIGKGRGYS